MHCDSDAGAKSSASGSGVRTRFLVVFSSLLGPGITVGFPTLPCIDHFRSLLFSSICFLCCLSLFLCVEHLDLLIPCFAFAGAGTKAARWPAKPCAFPSLGNARLRVFAVACRHERSGLGGGLCPLLWESRRLELERICCHAQCPSRDEETFQHSVWLMCFYY